MFIFSFLGEIAISPSREIGEIAIAIEIGEIAIAISPIEEIAIAISPRKCDLFWVLFVFLGMNMYSFGN